MSGWGWKLCFAGAVVGLVVPFVQGQSSEEGEPPFTVSRKQGLSTLELVRSATLLADGLRSWDLVINSPRSIQVAAPAFTRALENQLGSIEMLGHLLNEVNMRCGAKIQFIRRDAKDPEVLVASSRFDYESRILVTGRDVSSMGRSRGGTVLVELYEPAGERPVFAKRIRLSERGDREKDIREDERLAESERGRTRSEAKTAEQADRRVISASAIDPSQTADRSSRRRFEDESQVRETLFGRVEFEDKKTAQRLAVLSEGTKQLSDGRIQVQLTFVSRKKSQDVEIRTTFVDALGEELSKPAKKDFEFDEGKPQTVVFRSRKPAWGFVMRIEED